MVFYLDIVGRGDFSIVIHIPQLIGTAVIAGITSAGGVACIAVFRQQRAVYIAVAGSEIIAVSGIINRRSRTVQRYIQLNFIPVCTSAYAFSLYLPEDVKGHISIFRCCIQVC